MKKSLLALIILSSTCLAQPIKLIDKDVDEKYPIANEPYENILAEQDSSINIKTKHIYEEPNHSLENNEDDSSIKKLPLIRNGSKKSSNEDSEKYKIKSETDDSSEKKLPLIRHGSKKSLFSNKKSPSKSSENSKIRFINKSSMSRSQIDHVSKTCQDKINKMWEQRSQIPRNEMADFQRAMGEAQTSCSQIKKVNEEMFNADDNIKSFDKNMMLAQSKY